MRFVKLSEIYIEKDCTVEAGHAFINLAEVRKIIKFRDPMGKHCSRISFTGLSKSDDLFFRETPLEIAERCLPNTGNGAPMALDGKKFDEHRVLRERPLTPQSDPEFVTNFGEDV